MFIGTVPRDARVLITEIVRHVDSKVVYVGCSGNFTIDKIMSNLGFDVYSNDVSLYSKLIADIILGTKTEFEITNGFYKEIYDSWPESKFKDIIFYFFMQRLIKFERRLNDYQNFMFDSYLEKNKEFHDRTLKKIERTKQFEFRIRNFFFGDFIDHIKSSPSNAIISIFPPTYKGGYERMYARLDEVFKYDKPKYEIFDSDNAGEIYNWILSEYRAVIYSDRIFKEVEKFITAKIDMGGKKHDVYLYTNINSKPHYFINSRNLSISKYYKMIDDDFVFVENTEIKVIPIKVNILNYYKSLFMSVRVNYAESDDYAIGFFADGKLFGFASFSKFFGTINNDLIFLVSDFVVNVNIKRLSKLVLYLLLSDEVRKLLMSKFHYSYLGMQTSVYTDKPVSMKYRGVFKLERRDKDKLVYVGYFNGKSLQENFLLWYKKNYNK